MSDKVLIKQEIERRVEQCYRLLTQDLLERERNETNCCLQQYKELIQFIDTLPEEHNELKKDYRERYEKLSQSDNFKQAYCNKSLGSEEHNEDLEEAANKYGKEEPILPESYNDGDIPDYEKWTADAFKVGAQWQKQRMIKDAVETTIVNGWQYGKEPDYAIIPAIHQRISGFNVGDKVKIIIVKEEQQ